MKDCTTCKYGYEDERLGIPMCHHPKRFSDDCVDFNMHEEKEIQESEKPESTDIEEPVCGDLDEAAKAYTDARDWAKENHLTPYIRQAFKAGANWQKTHDAELIEIAYNDGITIGKTKQKEQMMKEAEETDLYWDGDFLAIDLNMRELGYSEHDKVRVIMCKKED